jgi:hypothetical protein
MHTRSSISLAGEDCKEDSDVQSEQRLFGSWKNPSRSKCRTAEGHVRNGIWFFHISANPPLSGKPFDSRAGRRSPTSSEREIQSRGPRTFGRARELIHSDHLALSAEHFDRILAQVSGESEAAAELSF